jgi:hypothetical protein
MGQHDCLFCTVDNGHYSRHSSGDVTLRFSSGRAWRFPDMVLHYLADEKWMPSQEFIDDVMNHECTGGERSQTRCVSADPVSIGYLEGSFPKGNVPAGFIKKLEELMIKYDTTGNVENYVCKRKKNNSTR